jgi:ribosomal protein S18 acetylase RimI-like enzyme
MADLTVRRFESPDAEAVCDLHERVLRDAGAFDPELTHLDADLQQIECVYLDSGGEFLVGEYESEVVAMGAFRPLVASGHDAALPFDHAAVVDDPEATAVLKRIRVAPDHYRQGFGTRILDELERRAWGAGFEALVLDTTPTQEAAIAFYEQWGCERVAREETEYGTVLLYRRTIGQRV